MIGEARASALDDAGLIAASSFVRQRMLRMCLASEWGHIGGCSSAVEMLTALYLGGVLRYSQDDPVHPDRDRVLVRGHLGPTRYAIFALLGWIQDEELDGHARLGSRLQGHETRLTPGVDVGPSGSLGMSLSYGVGIALAASVHDSPWVTFVVLGDGEEQEGNVAEAARHAIAADIRRLVVVIDRNGKQLSGPTTEADTGDLGAIWAGYGWQVLHCPDGNDVLEIRQQLECARIMAESGPVVVVADTKKGAGLEGASEHFSGLHELGHADQRAIKRSLGPELEPPSIVAATLPPAKARPKRSLPTLALAAGTDWSGSPDGYQLQVLSAMASEWRQDEHGRLYFLYADTFPTPLLARTGLSTAATCMNVGIREQHLVAMGHGISLADPESTIVLHTGDPFLLRAADQLLAASQEDGVSFVIIGDDAGLSNARNGGSHQSSLQPLLMHSLPNVRCFEPAVGIDMLVAANRSIRHAGISYIRVHDADMTGVPDALQRRRAVDTRIDRADVLLIASGMMVLSALEAEKLLAADGVAARVIAVSDFDAVRPEVLEDAPAVLLYDGHPDVLRNWWMERDSLTNRPVRSLGFRHGTSGTLDELLSWTKLDSTSVANVALDVCSRREGRS